MSRPAQAPGAGVYLARHGRTAYNHERRFQGQLPVPLDDEGRAQAGALAEQAAATCAFQKLWCSPLLRARETADIVARRLELAPQEDARLMETDAGDWTDRTFVDIQQQAPGQFARFIELDPDFAFPGGESFAGQSSRVAEVLGEIECGPLPALVVCHGVVIRLALTRYRPGEPAPRVANAALVALGEGATAPAPEPSLRAPTAVDPTSA
jgi:broad specificity phosphatase PhoE